LKLMCGLILAIILIVIEILFFSQPISGRYKPNDERRYRQPQ